MVSALLAVVLAAPVFSIDGGVMVGGGGSPLPAELQSVSGWFRVGPEVLGGVASGALSLHAGVGYQYASYGGVDRHEVMGRLLSKYRFALDEPIEHAIGLGAMVRVSYKGSSTRLDYNPSYAAWLSTIHRFAFTATYGPSFAVDRDNRIGLDFTLAIGPGFTSDDEWATNFEALFRLGWEHRFR